ncbi:MAG: 6-phosphogluconolactonase [Acidobacteriota bacterium]
MSTSSTSNAAAEREHRHADPQALADALAERVASDLRSAVAERGTASLVVSGGSTPRPFFDRLSRTELPWQHVAVTLADERWVPADHPDSNERLVRKTLLVEAAADARFVSLVNDAATPEAGRDACERALATIPRPFDVVVLGMGGDGHTASLFPETTELTAGLDPFSSDACLAVNPKTAPHARMSLTLRAILDSRRLILHITGDGKWDVYQRALEPGPASELPIRAALQSGRVEVWWAP